MTLDPSITKTMRAYKGAPLSVIIALLIYNCSMTKADLSRTTGYSERKLDGTLLFLEGEGLVQNNGYMNGWSLTDGIKQLPLFHRDLLEDFVTTTVNNSQLPLIPSAEESAKFADSQPNTKQFPQNLRKVSADSADFLTRARVTTTSNTSQANHTNQKASSSNKSLKSAIFALSRQQPEIYELLLEGGIGAETPKMLELLQLHLDVDCVEPHVLQFLFEQKRDNGRHSPGMLIYRLIQGDPPPPLRCRKHLEVLEPCMQCELAFRMEAPMT